MPIDIDIAKDFILIALCAACAIYCVMLSSRLRKLNDLKTGVGASILSLTKAIEETHQATLASRHDISDAIEDMQSLLREADVKSARLEARLKDLGRGAEAAGQMARRLERLVDNDAIVALDVFRRAADRSDKAA